MKHRLSWSTKRTAVVDAAWFLVLRNGWGTNAFVLSQLENYAAKQTEIDEKARKAEEKELKRLELIDNYTIPDVVVDKTTPL